MARIERTIVDSGIASAAAGAIIAGVGVTILVHGFIFGLVGVAWGGGIIAASILSLYYPGRHALLGALIIVFSISSWYGTSGGLIIGFIIGVIGGFMTLTWHPLNKKGQSKPDQRTKDATTVQR